MLKRTQTEIKARYESRAGADPFWYEAHEYLKYLTWESAEPYLSEGITERDWQTTKDDPAKLVEKEIRGKVGEGSIERITAWLWLAGEDGLLSKLAGKSDKDVLKVVSAHFAKPKAFNVKDEDNESGA